MIIKKRYHLNQWYHYTYIILVFIICWFKTSYFSLLHWIFGCIFIWHKGHKFLEIQVIERLKLISKIHFIISSIVLGFFLILLLRDQEEYAEFLESVLDFKIGVFGFQSVLSLLIWQTILYIALMGILFVMIQNFKPPEQDGYAPLQHEQYTIHQKKVAFQRQKDIIQIIIILIIVLISLNDGLVTFILMVCMLCWFAVHYHLVDQRDRFQVQKYITNTIAYGSLLSLFLLIYSGLNTVPINWGFATGTLTIYRVFRFIGILHFSSIVMCAVRALHYQAIVPIDEVNYLADQIKVEAKQSVSGLGLFLGQNYFGVIMFLSFFWISKQFSILRGLVYILLLIGQIKRQKFKYTKRWQCSIAILYLACLQFFILYLFNIPQLNGGTYMQFIGVYKLPEFDPTQSLAIWNYFIQRLNVIFFDLSYIIILTWLVYGQQTIEDRRKQKQIDEIVSNRKSNKSQQSDFWYTFKKKINDWFQEVKRSFYIHFDEIVIIYCLISALYNSDVCRGVFLVYFILYEFINLSKRRKYMRQHLMVGFIILFTLYTLQLLFQRNLTILNLFFLRIGLNEVSESYYNSFYFVYQYYDIIFGCILLTFQIQIVQKSEIYKRSKMLKKKKMFKQHDYDEEPEFFRTQLIKNGLTFCQIIMLIVAFIPAANLLSLIFVFFFQIYLYLYFLYGTQKAVMERLIEYWPIIILLTLMILCLRYTYTINMVYVVVEMYFRQPTLLSDLGLNPNFNTVKLLGNGIALMLLCSYRRAYESADYHKIMDLKEEQQTFVHGSLSYFWYSVKIRLAVLCIYHLQKFIFLFAFFIAVYQLSYIGLLFACLIFLIVAREIDNNWQDISVPFLVVLFLQIVIQYSFQAEMLRASQGQETIQWIGIQDQYSAKYWWLMILFHVCEMLPVINSVCKKYVYLQFSLYQISYDREIVNIEHISKLINILLSGYIEVKSRPQDQSDSEISFQQDNSKLRHASFFPVNVEDPGSRFDRMCDFWQKQTQEQQYQEYLLLAPFYNSLTFHQQVDKLFTQVGLEISLFIIVITAYYERNFFSVFYIIVASIFAGYSFLLDKRPHGQSLISFRTAWICLCVLQMMEVIRKYIIIQWTPPSWDVRKPWWYYQYSCEERGKEAFKQNDPNDQISDFMKCQTDWNFWLSLQGYTWIDIWINFLAFLVSACFSRHFSTIQRQQQDEEQDRSFEGNSLSSFDNNIIDPNDFTYQKNRKQISDYIKFFIFCYFYKLALIIFLLIGMSNDISSYTEVISSIYFFVAINLLYMSDKLETERNQIWTKLILFNMAVMVLMSLYQAPFVKCPIIYEDSRYYYDNSECIEVQLQNHYYNSDFFIFLQDEFMLLSRKTIQNESIEQLTTWNVLYMFLSHMLGLNKTLDFQFGFNRETLMAFFFLFGLLQRNIWAHPYMKMYVDPYLRREQGKYRQAAIRLIEGIHLKRIWDFKYVQAQKEVHNSLQLRVQERVKKWDEFLQFDETILRHQQQSVFFLGTEEREEEVRMLNFQDEAEDQRQQHTPFDSDDFEKMKTNNKLLIKAEKITSQSVAPPIQLFDVCFVVTNAVNEEDLQLRLQKLKLLEEKYQLQAVYLNEKIGLQPYNESVLKEIEKRIHRLELEILKIGQRINNVASSESSSQDNKSDIIQSQINLVHSPQSQSAKSARQFHNNFTKDEPKSSASQKSTKSIAVKMSEKIKSLIIDILTHDTYIRESVQQQQGIEQKRLSALLFIFVSYYFQVVCVIIMVANACFNANLLAIFYPFSAFLYGMLENPVPTRKFWNFLIIYTIVVISLKFLYQMPIFCDSPPYRFIGFSAEEACEARVTTQLEKITRIDYVIGIRKYSHPENFLSQIWIEILLFIALLIQRYLLQTQGIWDYFKLSGDCYFIPQFELKKKEEKHIKKKSSEPVVVQEEEVEDDFSEIQHEDSKSQDGSPSFMDHIQNLQTEASNQLVNFYYRLFPSALPQQYSYNMYQPQSKMYVRKDVVIQAEQIKTGRDYYVSGFIVCLLTLIYFLLFYPNIIAKRSYAHITQGNSQRFSSEVIFVILIVLLIIVVDRILFITRKINKAEAQDFSRYTLMIKVGIHFLLILVVHYYFFITIPRKTNKRFQESIYLILAYLLICIYFFISATQIRYGYPIQEVTQVFTGSSKTLNQLAFKIYRAIPFLYELGVIIDWTFTPTALDLTQWFRLEDIFTNLYICSAYMEYRLENHELGARRKKAEKCTSGCLFALLFIFIIILPILIFSSLNPAVEINNISQGKFSIKAAFFGQDDKLYFTLFQTNDIEVLEIPNDQFQKIQKVYGEIETNWQERMQKVRIKRFSDAEWNLADNYRDQIRNMIKSQNYQVEISCEWTFLKNDRQGGQKSFTGSSIVTAPDSFVNNFGKILAPKAPDAVFDINSIIPKFLYVGEQAETQILRLEPVNIREENDYFQNIRLIHKKTSQQVFFELVPNDDSQDLKTIGASANNRVELFVLNELAFGSIIGALSNNVSIIGIYATFVLTIGRILRLTYDKISTRVIYEEMPETHELFDLCQSIYIARVDGNFRKEEIFYELLIRIYRSPEILFKMTGSSIYDKVMR